MKSLSFIPSINPSEEDETSRRHTGHATDLDSSAEEEEEEEEEEKEEEEGDRDDEVVGGSVLGFLEGGEDVFLLLSSSLPLFVPTVWSEISPWSEEEEEAENRASRQREQKE